VIMRVSSDAGVDRPRTHAYCHAPHPDRRRSLDACGKQLESGIPGKLEFITLVDAPPLEGDGTLYLPCKRKACGKWNRFSITVAADLPAAVTSLRIAAALGHVPRKERELRSTLDVLYRYLKGVGR
jgi:hypothetical protein